MRLARHLLPALLLAFGAGPAAAADLSVPAATPGALAAALAAASPGDRLLLAPGRHPGPVLLDRPVELVGQPGAVVDGGGRGRVVTIDAPDVRLRGLAVTGSGSDLAAEDSAVYVTARGDRAVVEDNRIQGNLIGVFLKGPEDAVVRRNLIEGRRDLRMSERGNGVQLWNAPGSVVEENEIRFGRDGIFTLTSSRNRFLRNRLEQVRFAIHYMYTNNSRVEGNLSIGNHTALAIMFSNRVEILGNRAEAPRDHGLMLNAANYARVVGNTVVGGPDTGQCLFVYNANKNEIAGNRFAGCQIGAHVTAGAEGNAVHGNAFVGNRTQVKYVGTRFVDWSAGGRGNFWSDHWAFDLDRDGVADQAYRPNDMVDQVLWAVPLAKALVNSPVTQLLRWAQTQFPALHPGGLLDSAPLMTPSPPAPQPAEAALAARP